MRILAAVIALLLVTGCQATNTLGSSRTVYFDFGSSTVSKKDAGAINDLAKELKQGVVKNVSPWKHDNCFTKVGPVCKHGIAGVQTVTLVGHTDTVGSPAANQALSNKRVNAVAELLAKAGIDSKAINGSGKGETDPAIPTGDNVKEERNRRVVIYIR